MRTISWRIVGAFGLIDECFNELKHGESVRWGDSTRETFDDAIRTYKRCVEKIDEKISKLLHGDTATCKKNCQFN